MKRSRVVAAAPSRSASATWAEIEELVRSTLAASATIDENSVAAGMSAARGVGRLLVAGGHLDTYPLVLVAPPVHLSISTVSGPRALEQEVVAGVPGGSTATEWTLYLPTPEPLGAAVQAATNAHANLSAAEAPLEAKTVPRTGIDRIALARRVGRHP